MIGVDGRLSGLVRRLEIDEGDDNMKPHKRNVYSNDLIKIIHRNKLSMNDIKLKLGDDDLINQGLFLMSSAYFEGALRDLMYKILMSYPEKLRKDNFSVNKEVLYGYNDYMILNEIIDNELFNLFKGNVKEQLLYIIELSSNIKCENIKNKRKNKDVVDIISKCSDISIYRNCLIHNSGFTTKDFSDRVSIYKHEINQRIDFNERLITQFINDYLLFFDFLEEKILKNIDYIKGTEIDKLRNLWNQCFNSNLLIFDEYWVVDEERDLIIDIKYPEYESSISSSEKVYLSIWRHQFYDGIPTEEFLICSINEDIIYTIYKGLDEIKFYHMYQQAHG